MILCQSITPNSGTLVLNLIRRLHVNRSVSCNTTPTSMLSLISANPENEGKVFLYRYGKKIFDKVMEAMQSLI